METTKGRFSGLNFMNTAVQSGKKATLTSRAELSTAPTKDSFALNGNASDLLGVKAGDRVVLFDRGARNIVDGVDMGANDINNRYFIAKGYTQDGVEKGAKLATVSKVVGLGQKNSFSFSAIWPSVLHTAVCADDVKKEVSMEELLEAGIIRPTTVGKGGKQYFTANTRVRLELVELGESDVAADLKGNVISVKLFALTNAKVEEIAADDKE